MAGSRIGHVIAAGVLMLSMAACVREVAGAPTAAPVQAELRPLSMTSGCAVEGDLEGRFSAPGQMPSYLECVLPGVVQWLGSVYQRMPPPEAFVFVPRGFTGNDSGCELNATVLQYCKPSRTVYFGEQAVWEQYTTFGDAAPAVIAAHEVTHHVQELLRMPQPTVPNDVIRYENQADCGAGAFMAYAREQGWLSVADDVEDLAGSLQAAGEDDGPERTHGTIDERLRSFDLAYLSKTAQPMAACVPFVPEVPIITAQPR